MSYQTRFSHLILILLLVVVGLWIFKDPQASQAQQGGLFESPLPTPTPDEGGVDPTKPPTPTPTPPPTTEAQRALAYIAEQKQIPLEALRVVNEHERQYPLTGRTFRAFVILDTRAPETPDYGVLIDLVSGDIETDWAAVEAAERDAYRAKYGKLQPALYERLQQVENGTLLPVAIWAAGVERQPTVGEVYAELAAQFPEAARALAEGLRPWQVEDTALSAEIEETYDKLRAEDVSERTQPLVDYLRGQGFSVEVIEGMPSLAAMLPKEAILALESRDDVETIYLLEGELSLAIAEAVATDRIPAVWQRGKTGSGRRIAILEPNNITSNCLNILHTRTAQFDPDLLVNLDHKTEVANITACDNDSYRGMAYGAGIVDAAYTTDPFFVESDMVNALRWAIDATRKADVVNVSVGYHPDNNVNWLDRAFDYWARAKERVFVIIAGNEGQASGSIKSPGKGWNVITAGGVNDRGTAAWSDDAMYANSSYVNPAGGDREKPEVVAPAENITLRKRDDTTEIDSGTSLAAPQVAGLAALLLERDLNLVVEPNAVKAIMMASAVHDIDDSTTADHKDGAGGIDAALADEIAQHQAGEFEICNRPCWWKKDTTNSDPVQDGSLFRDFLASRGERIRVAISWFSNADGPGFPSSYTFDRLDTNYNLNVYYYTSNNILQLVTSSASVDNNYEWVEFVAPSTAQYVIEVRRSSIGDNNEASNTLGIAWSRQATYLPQVMANVNGWQSKIFVRNDGATATTPTIIFYDTAGNDYGPFTPPDPIDPNEVWTLLLDSGLFEGSGIVSGSEDLSVVVENHNQRANVATNYTGILANGQGGNPAWGQAATTLYETTIKRDFSNATSELHIMNVGSASTNVTIQYYDDNGTLKGTLSCSNLAPNAKCLKTVTNSGWGSLLNAKISASQPLAVVNVERDAAGSPSRVATNNAAANPTTLLYAPIYKKNWYSQNTSLRIRNSDSANASITITYYDEASSAVYSEGPYTIPPNGVLGRWAPDVSVLPSSFAGSARISSNQDIVARLYEAGAVRKMSNGTFVQGSQASYAVRACNTCGGWRSYIRVQNVGSTAAEVQVRYYDSGGNAVGNPETLSNLGVYRARNAASLPGGLDGSAVLTADQPIIVRVYMVYPDTSKDLSMTYDAPNR